LQRDVYSVVIAAERAWLERGVEPDGDTGSNAQPHGDGEVVATELAGPGVVGPAMVQRLRREPQVGSRSAAAREKVPVDPAHES